MNSLICSLLLSAATLHQWNIQTYYSSLDVWENSLVHDFSELHQYKGRLHESPENLLKALTLYNSLECTASHQYIYAHLKHYENVADPHAKAAADKAQTVLQKLQQDSSWLAPEILSLPDEHINAPALSPYKVHLEQLSRHKPHILSPTEEELLALASGSLQTASNAFSALQNADMKFGQIEDGDHNLVPLSEANYASILSSPDRTLRKNAYHALSSCYLAHENSIGAMFDGVVKAHHFNAKARRYASCLEASLYPNNIDVSVYHSLIEAVRGRVDLLHRYMALKKKVLKLDQLYLYDTFAPLTANDSAHYSYDEAVALVLQAVEPLGEEYVARLKKGLNDDRWVDAFPRENKRTGAFSWGSYTSQPYIMMNYTGRLRDVFTLAHEAGHSMHRLYTNQSQPYHYASHSVFIAEVASTFNESLLRHMLLQKAATKQERAHLLAQALDDIRATLYQQTLYAEFELFAHQLVENGQPLTVKLLKEKFSELFSYYFGKELTIDPAVGIMWARVPHFYTNFYVYQYATGVSASLALCQGVLEQPEENLQKYIQFLRGGSSEFPLDLLAKAGCDMRTCAPIHKALDLFDAYLTELEQLLEA